jgi:hypothetical protein
LDNPGTQIKEYTIATEVLGRDETYDPRIDSMVRVQAGRLRSKVQEYYSGEGKAGRVVIELPKGHYTPAFRYQAVEETGARSAAGLSETAVSGKPIPASGSSPTVDPRLKWAVLVLGGLCVALFLLAVSNYRQIKNLSETQASSIAKLPESEVPTFFWNDFLRSPEPVLVAFSNTRFQGTAESGMKLLNPLDSLPAGYSRSVSHNEPSKAVTEHYTGVGEVMGVYFLGELFSKYERPFRVKRSLLLTWDDLKSENFVFLGSPAENLLLRELPHEQDFVFGGTTNSKIERDWGIINLRPRPGEQTNYLAQQEGPSRSHISEDYALVSMLDGLDTKHRLLILAGITTYGTQAAAEYVTKPGYLKQLLTHLKNTTGSDKQTLPEKFQVLLKVKVNGGVPVQISYVTHHVLR